MTCQEAQAALLLHPGPGGSPEAAAHHQACPACAAGSARVAALGQRLLAYRVADPPPGQIERTMAAVASLLAARRELLREPRRRLVRAVTVVLALLPLVVVANARLVRAAYEFLTPWLPSYLTVYLVVTLGLVLALQLALSCAAVPLLAARQRFRLPEEIHV